jgi:next-to-BRCA1 protein 1
MENCLATVFGLSKYLFFNPSLARHRHFFCSINVVEADSSEESMAASSVIMPAASSAPQSERVPSVTLTTLSTQTHSLASDDNLSDAGSDMSLISMPSSPSDDEVWHETRSRPSNPSGAPTAATPGSPAASAVPGMDYVLLYDDESSDDEKK